MQTNGRVLNYSSSPKMVLAYKNIMCKTRTRAARFPIFFEGSGEGDGPRVIDKRLRDDKTRRQKDLYYGKQAR